MAKVLGSIAMEDGMKRSVLASAMLTICLPAMNAFAEANAQSEKQLIPLKDIWAYYMPGTRDIQQLNTPMQKDLVELIQVSLGQRENGDQPKQGFIVQGDDKMALRTAYDVLVTGKGVPKGAKPNQQTWIVFFSRDSNQFVHLHDVSRQGDQITVRYQFVPHDSQEMTRHFALIPVGSLPAGSYRVSVVNLPMEKRYFDVGYRPMPESFVSKIVCKAFGFVIGENKGH